MDVQSGPLGIAPCQLGVEGGGVGRCPCHNATASAVTSCSESLGKVSLRLPATLPESGTPLVQNGPVSIFDFPRGLPRCSVAQHVW